MVSDSLPERLGLYSAANDSPDRAGGWQRHRSRRLGSPKSDEGGWRRENWGASLRLRDGRTKPRMKMVVTLALILTFSPKEKEHVVATPVLLTIARQIPSREVSIRRRTILPLLEERAGVKSYVKLNDTLEISGTPALTLILSPRRGNNCSSVWIVSRFRIGDSNTVINFSRNNRWSRGLRNPGCQAHRAGGACKRVRDVF